MGQDQTDRPITPTAKPRWVDVSPGLQRRIAEHRPFPGMDSYQAEDQRLFFGRQRESRQVVDLILSNRFSLIHAPSGAGKTSLLNAMVIPALEYADWVPVRTTPQTDPTRALQIATLLTVVPRPDAERDALMEIQRDLGGEATLADMVDAHFHLESRDPRTRQWIAPYQAKRPGDADEWVTLAPYLCRLLRATASNYARLQQRMREEAKRRGERERRGGDHEITAGRVWRSLIERYVRSIGGLFDWQKSANQSGDAAWAAFGPETRLSELIERLRDPDLMIQYDAIWHRLDPPFPGLRLFFEELFRVWAPFVGRLRLVLIVDQFEEIFTQFVDRSGLQDPDRRQWRLRPAFFRNLRSLYESGRLRRPEGEDADDRGPAPYEHEDADLQGDQSDPLPIRYVISMRDEWIAKLDDIRQFVPRLDLSSYHLTWLRREEVATIITTPSKEFENPIPDLLARIVEDDLTHEGRYVEPAQLQIVCERLWQSEETATASVTALPDDPRITEDHLAEPFVRRFVALGGTRGIVGGHFLRVLRWLRELEPRSDEVEALEEEAAPFLDRLHEEREVVVLELLTPLITNEGTRNVAPYDSLVQAPFRDQAQRGRLLEALEDGRIVRAEWRLSGMFVEITHEFLIAPIQVEIRRRLTNNPKYQRFRDAVARLADFCKISYRAPLSAGPSWSPLDALPSLPAEAFAALHDNRHRLRLPHWATEVMVKNAICHAREPGPIRSWVRAYVEHPRPDQQLISELIKRARESWRPANAFDIAELSLLQSLRASRHHGEAGEVRRNDDDGGQDDSEAAAAGAIAAFATASAVFNGRSGDPEFVKQWLRWDL